MATDSLNKWLYPLWFIAAIDIYVPHQIIQSMTYSEALILNILQY